MNARSSTARRGRALLVAQFCLAAGTVGWLLVAPPALGAMMLVPLTPGAARTLLETSLDGGNRLLGQGPLPGSIILYGRRSPLAWRMLARGVLTVASDSRGCSIGDGR